MAMRPLDGSSDRSGLRSPGNAGHFSAGHPLACQAFTRLAQVWLRIRDDGCPALARLAQPGWRSAIRSIVERRGMRDDDSLGPTAWDPIVTVSSFGSGFGKVGAEAAGYVRKNTRERAVIPSPGDQTYEPSASGRWT